MNETKKISLIVFPEINENRGIRENHATIGKNLSRIKSYEGNDKNIRTDVSK
jgi:hypothetical protein